MELSFYSAFQLSTWCSLMKHSWVNLTYKYISIKVWYSYLKFANKSLSDKDRQNIPLNVVSLWKVLLKICNDANNKSFRPYWQKMNCPMFYVIWVKCCFSICKSPRIQSNTGNYRKGNVYRFSNSIKLTFSEYQLYNRAFLGL